MSKGKQGGGSEIESLRGANRQLKKQVEYLKKQIGRSDKAVRKYIHEQDERHEHPENKNYLEDSKGTSTPCKGCGKEINVVEFGKRMIYNCLACGYRKVKITG